MKSNKLFINSSTLYSFFIPLLLIGHYIFASNLDTKVIYLKKVSNLVGNKIRYNNLDNNYYVLMPNKNKIYILNNNFQHKRTIGKFGQGEGEFFIPTDFTIDCKNRIWVVDYFNSRIQLLDKMGKFIRKLKIGSRVFSIDSYDNDTIIYNNPSNKSIFTVIDTNTGTIDSRGFIIKIKWLEEIRGLTNKNVKFNNTRMSIKLNSGLVRSDSSVGILILSLFSPTISLFDINGNIIFKNQIPTNTFNCIASKSYHKLKMKLLNNSNEGSLVLFQDMVLVKNKHEIYIFPSSAKHPDSQVTRLDYNGNVLGSLKFIDSVSGDEIHPVSMAINDSTGIISSNLGIYCFHIN